MEPGRLEAFSDGVLAIIIAIMVLKIKVPHDADIFAALKPLFPIFLSYILCFAMILIYWNNHHHLFQSIDGDTGRDVGASHQTGWTGLVAGLI